MFRTPSMIATNFAAARVSVMLLAAIVLNPQGQSVVCAQPHSQPRVAVTATASVDNPNPAPNDPVIYTIRLKIEGAQMSLGNISAPELPKGLSSTPLQPVGKSESFEIVNGSISQSTDYRFIFRADKEGQYTIPAQELIFQNERIPVNAVNIRVSKSAAPENLPAELKDLVVPPTAPGNPELAKALNGGLFIMPMLSSRRIYEGQQVILSYHLVWDPAALARAGLRTDTMIVEGVEVPEFNQFVKEVTYPLPRSLAEARRDRSFGGRTFAVATLYEVALTPTRTGICEIEPARIQMQIPLARSGRGATLDPFANDPFFADDPIFGALSARMGAGNRVRLIANSPSLSIEVLPVPTANRPPEWKGAVGEFRIAAQLDRTTATANLDIIRLDVTIEGHGDAAGLAAPDLKLPQGLRLLEEPKATSRTRRENELPIQAKTFSYLLRPEVPGTIPIPPVELSVFDPSIEQFRTIRTEPLSVDILPGTAPANAVTIAQASPDKAAPAPTSAPKQDTTIMPDLRFLPALAPQITQQLPGTGGLILLITCPPLIAGILIGMVRHSAAKAARYMKSLEPALDTIRNRALTLASNPDKDSITALAALLRTDYARILGIQQSTPATFHEIQEALQRQFPDHPSNSDRLTAIRTILNAADALKYAAPGTPPPIEDWKALAIKAFADHPSTSTDPSHA